jgi:hypothetical protein
MTTNSEPVLRLRASSCAAPASAPATPPNERADGAESGADSADEGAVKRVRAALAEMDQR